jgi:hypothetical protein
MDAPRSSSFFYLGILRHSSVTLPLSLSLALSDVRDPHILHVMREVAPH